MNRKSAKFILLTIKQILDRTEIKFWLHGGTLLGAIRQGNFIPGDWDIDLITLAGDWNPKLALKIQEIFELVDFRNDSLYPFGYRKIVIKHKRAALSLLFYLYYAPQNVFVFPKRFGGKLVRDPRWCELSPLVLGTPRFVRLIGREFRVPYKSEELLEIMYGPTWRQPQLKGWDVGRRFEIIPPKKFIPWIEKHPKEAMRTLGPDGE